MAEGEVLSHREWQVPPAATAESRRLGWLNEATEEGQSWIRAQRGFSDFKKALDTISGVDTSGATRADYRSKLNTNRLKRNMREVIGTLAKLRPMWGYHSDNSGYKASAELFNKVTKAWYLESFADLKIKEALAFASATCRGWIRPIYRRDMYGTGHGDIVLESYGAPCVLPTQLPANNNWQSAYAVHILDEMPIAMAHGMFPQFQTRLTPTTSRYWYQNDGVRNAARGNLVQRMFGRGPHMKADPLLSDLLIPIRYSYVIDLSLNTTDKPITMGEPNSSWSYVVPYVGQDIPAGRDSSGRELTRKADTNDARLYPHRRLIISSERCIMYDGPSFDWHGMFPGVSFSLDEWPWEPLGFSLVHDGYEINEAIKEIYRGNMDKIRSQLDPSLAYDTNAISRGEAAKVDPMMPRGRYGYDGSQLEGAPFGLVVPEEVLKVTPESMAMIDKLESAMDSQMAINDLAALARMRAVGSMDELEKVMEANGPIVESMSRSMEPPMRDLGVMVKYLIMQYYTTTRVMQVVGEDQISPDTFDMNPDELIPSHAPSEDIKAGPSKFSSRQRARIFADNLRFFILPNSLHEMTQMMMKLGLVQLKKAGILIDSQTIAEAWSVPNYGDIPGNTVLERWAKEQEIVLEQGARMMAIKAALAAAYGGDGGAGGAGGAGGMPPPPGTPPQGNAEGRPPSGHAAPRLVQKDGGTRSTIAESK